MSVLYVLSKNIDKKKPACSKIQAGFSSYISLKDESFISLYLLYH